MMNVRRKFLMLINNLKRIIAEGFLYITSLFSSSIILSHAYDISGNLEVRNKLISLIYKIDEQLAHSTNNNIKTTLQSALEGMEGKPAKGHTLNNIIINAFTSASIGGESETLDYKIYTSADLISSNKVGHLNSIKYKILNPSTLFHSLNNFNSNINIISSIKSPIYNYIYKIDNAPNIILNIYAISESIQADLIKGKLNNFYIDITSQIATLVGISAKNIQSSIINNINNINSNIYSMSQSLIMGNMIENIPNNLEGEIHTSSNIISSNIKNIFTSSAILTVLEDMAWENPQITGLNNEGLIITQVYSIANNGNGLNIT